MVASIRRTAPEVHLTNPKLTSACVFICLTLPVLASAHGVVAFQQTRRDYYGPSGGVSIAAGDFNHDGVVDVAVGGETGIDIFFGSKPGGLQRAITLTGVSYIESLLAIDVNHDGILDLVAAETTDIAVLLGKADGSFRAPLLFGGFAYPYSLLASDFNGDGNVDLAFVNYVDSDLSSVIVLSGDGAGKFTVASTNMIEFLDGYLVAADFNHDGNLDLAISVGAGIDVLFGIGDGTFKPYETENPDTELILLVAADLNGDGNADLIAVDQRNNYAVAILLGNPDGTFLAPMEILNGEQYSQLAVADFNADGVPDILASSVQPFFVVLTGRGDGTFAAGEFAPCGDNSEIALADFDGDGTVDIASASALEGTGSTVSIFFGNGKGQFTRPPFYPVGMPLYDGPVRLADVNGDGNLDAVVGGNDGFSVLLGDGTGKFDAPLVFSQPSVYFNAFALADFNRDGNLDMVAAPNDGHVTNGVSLVIYFGIGDGTFQPPTTIVSNLDVSGLAIGDFNQDGNPDVIVTTGDYNDRYGHIYIFLGNGDGTFQPARKFYQNDLAGGQIALSDFNADGFLDVAVTTQTGIAILPGDGKGNLLAPIAANIGRYTDYLAVGDLNLDGIPDLVADAPMGPDLAASTIQILIGRGDGTFEVGSSATAFDPAFGIEIADMNGDSIPDIIVQRGAYEDFAVLVGTLRGTFAYPLFFAGGDFEEAIAVGDLNADGKPDVVTVNSVSARVSVLLNSTER